MLFLLTACGSRAEPSQEKRRTNNEPSHAAVSLDGIAIEAKDVPNAQNTVAAWLTDMWVTAAERCSQK